MKTLSFAKTSSFFKPIFYTFLRELAVIMIIQLSKNIRFITIGAQTASVGWLIP